MRRFRSLSSLTVALLFLFGCGKDLPELIGIDGHAWKDDRNGCGGKRTEMITAIQSEKEKLLALDEVTIVKMLGRPDRNELFKRNQKFYYYFLEPSSDCKGETNMHARKLVVRFNAMGLAKEVSVE